LRMLILRHLVQERDGLLQIEPSERTLIAFYASSIAHLFRGRSI
jgi:glycerol-3-phosphate O-acyltransferase